MANGAVINFGKAVSAKPYRNDGGSEIYGNAGAGSRVTNTPGASIFGSANKVTVHVPNPNDIRSSGYNRVQFVTSSGAPFAREPRGRYWIDRYSTALGNGTTNVMLTPSRSSTGRQSVYGMISAFSSPWQSGGFNYVNGQWLINTSTASGYNMVAVSGTAPVDQNLNLTRKQGGSITFTVGKTAIRQRYLGQTD